MITDSGKSVEITEKSRQSPALIFTIKALYGSMPP